jgi:CheY-like chemotaxis protein
MSVSQQIAAFLPFLRRYARALTGNQGSGDAYVMATIQAMVEDPQLAKLGSNPKVSLYRLFSKIWNSVALNTAPGARDPKLPADHHLSNITPLPRQAFLLMSLEGFNEADAAQILDIDVAALREHVAESGRELAEEIATDVLIIEDESLIAKDLEGLVESLGHEVIGVARTRSEALEIAKTRKPGLILADIQLADGSSGLDAVNDLLKTFEVPVIFITAYPERFLTGDRPEPAFLIAKPFQPATVSAVISQALFFERKAHIAPKRASAG